MPKYVLSTDEKERIKKLYETQTAEINEIMKYQSKALYKKLEIIQYDDLDERLNDEKTVTVYHISNQIKEIWDKQDDMIEEIKNSLGDSFEEKKEDMKWLKCLLKTDGSNISNEYNRNLIENYKKNPDLVFAKAMRMVFSIPPTDLKNCEDKPEKLMEYYKQNHAAIDLAKAIVDNYKNEKFMRNATSNLEFKNLFDEELIKGLDAIAYPSRLAEYAHTDEYLACPYLTYDQVCDIANYKDFKNETDSQLFKMTNAMKNGVGYRTPCKFFKTGVDRPGKDFLNDYMPITNVGIENENKKDSEHQFDDNDIKFIRRDSNPKIRAACVNKAFMVEYKRKFAEAFNKKMGYNNGNVINYDRVEADHKGGFFERLGNSTSPEYINFLKAFKGFTNPDAEVFLDAYSLRMAAEAYLNHKAEQHGILEGDNYIGAVRKKVVDESKFSGTSLNRIHFVKNVLELLDEQDKILDETDKYLNIELPVNREPFDENIIKNDIEDNVIENNNNDAVEHNNNIDLDELNNN